MKQPVRTTKKPLTEIIKDKLSLLLIGTFLSILFFLILCIIVGYYHSKPYKCYLLAMQQGEGAKAVYWAEKTLRIAEKNYQTRLKKYDYSDDNRLKECQMNLCYALELNGEYEKALALWKDIYKYDEEREFAELMESKGVEKYGEFYPATARILMKQKREKESFETWCLYAEQMRRKYAEVLDGRENAYERRRILGWIRTRVIPMNFEFWKSPYSSYDNFLYFMEDQYELLGKPEEYRTAMELFRELPKGLPP